MPPKPIVHQVPTRVAKRSVAKEVRAARMLARCHNVHTRKDVARKWAFLPVREGGEGDFTEEEIKMILDRAESAKEFQKCINECTDRLQGT